MAVHFILLIVFNIATHNDHRLPHKEKEKSTEQCQHKYHYACNDHHLRPPVNTFHPIDKPVYEIIILRGFAGTFITVKLLLHKINYKPRYLWRQYVEIVGKKYEQYTCSQTDTVFPEVFIECFKMFQSPDLISEIREHPLLEGLRAMSCELRASVKMLNGQKGLRTEKARSSQLKARKETTPVALQVSR
jgi:hypothetical protein